MCGISGYFEFNTISPIDHLRRLVLDVAKRQNRRGPDFLGVSTFSYGEVHGVLAHNRLSIIDLSSNANQPLFSHDQRYAICFNGEVYNYLELRSELSEFGIEYRTSSDTEVLLYYLIKKGPQHLDQIEGMFSFVFLDQLTQRCIFARDRFGSKPLAYCSTSTSFAFASDPAALNLLVDSDVNELYCAQGSRYKYYESDSCMTQYSNINYLPPGHFATLDLRTMQIAAPQPYFSLSQECDIDSNLLQSLGFRDKCNLIREALYKSVEFRLRSDVPCGLSLSGGVDSNIISAISVSLKPGLQHFVYGDPDDETSEAHTVRNLRPDIANSVHYVREPKSKERIEELFYETLTAQGAPFPHTSQLAQYSIFKEARRNGVPVILGGQGADEAFMGYRKFFLYHILHLYGQRQLPALVAFCISNSSLIPAVMPKASIFWRERRRYARDNKSNQSCLPETTMPGIDDLMALEQLSPGYGLQKLSASQRQYLDIYRFSLPTLLRYEDRNSMAASIESRLPFLSPGIMKIGALLPTKDKLRYGFGKYILRKAFEDTIHPQILFNRDKRGFDTNHFNLIRRGIGPLVRHSLTYHFGPSMPLHGGSTADIATYFSDSNLSTVQGRFAEATTLIWANNLMAYC